MMAEIYADEDEIEGAEGGRGEGGMAIDADLIMNE